MVVALILFLPLFLVSIFLFLRCRPKLDLSEQRVVVRFDRAVFLVALLASGGAAAYFRSTTGESVDRAWWPVLAGLSALVLSSLVLFVGFVIRSLMFKPRRGGE